MTNEDVEAIAEKAAQKAVQDTLLLMGVSISDASSIIKMQQDFKHLRESREGREEFVKKGKNVVVGVFITTCLALLIKGFWAEVASFFARGGS